MFGSILGFTGLNLLGQYLGGKQQSSSNMAIARYQNEANRQMMQEYNEYNTPANQMKRFQDAGLNPHLVYGQGSPGNQSSPQQAAPVAPTDWQRVFQVAPILNQTAMTNAQVQALDAKTRKDTVLTDLARLQAQVVKRNPLLDDGAFQATIDSLKSAAEAKALDVKRSSVALSVEEATKGQAVEKVWREVDLLEQRFKLGNVDAKIKAEILKSKEFQNAILEVQKKFLADGNIGPQQIYQFISLLLMKAL